MGENNGVLDPKKAFGSWLRAVSHMIVAHGKVTQDPSNAFEIKKKLLHVENQDGLKSNRRMRNSPKLNRILIPRDVQTSNTQGTPTQSFYPIPQLMMTPNPPNSCFPPTPKLPTNSNLERNMPMDLISNEAKSHLDPYSSLFEPTPNGPQEEPDEICLHLDPNLDITNPTLDLLIPKICPSLTCQKNVYLTHRFSADDGIF